MCGIVGIVGHAPVNLSLYDALTVLQHRGQDAAGIVTFDDSRFHLRKADGLVSDVFHTRHMQRLRGNMGIAHVRYPTAGSSSTAEAQPLYVNFPFGITLGHNGNLTNADELKRELFLQDRRHLNTDSDSEILLNVFAQELYRQASSSIRPDDIFAAVESVHRRCRGAYAVIGMTAGGGIFAFRDPFAIRPVVFGVRKRKRGKEYMVASESVALDFLGFERVRDLRPGEAIHISAGGEFSSRDCATESSYSPCIFEYVYFARPDSVLDNVSVHKARMRMGNRLARKIRAQWSVDDIDVVIPVPDSSRTAAQEVGHCLQLKYREGLIKNRYIGRTFIMPGQQQRRKSVRQKLNPIRLEFEGRNVLLVDDSIVRGTTSKEIVQMARDAGARKVYFASAAPPIRYPNIYGIDMPAAHELVAHGRTDDEVCAAMGADRLIYQDLPDLVEAVNKGNPQLSQFDCSVFDGRYVVDVEQRYFEDLEKRRADAVKAKRKRHGQEAVGIDLYNNA
ncbi:MAG: amidophosphoribosyltransferase [Gammaproteobacteria bacterium]